MAANNLNLLAICISNGVGIALMVMLIMVYSTAKGRSNKKEDIVFLVMCYGIIAGCFCETLSFMIDGRVFTGSRIINYLANTYLYSTNLLLSLLLIFYVDLGIYGRSERLLAKYKTQITVSLLMISLNIVNFFYPIIYYISENNIYSRLPLGYSFYLAIIYNFATAYRVEIRYERENGTRSFFNIYMFFVPIVIGVGLQFLVYGLSVAWLSCGIGLTGLYMMQQNELAYIDSLLDIFNRRYFDYVISSWIDRGVSFAGAMLDIDRFKYINDTFGHSEGDNALKTVSDILKSCTEDNEWVFRFAGDEFIILKRGDSSDVLNDYFEKVEKQISAFNEDAQLYKLSLSYGISFFENSDTNSFIKEMDQKMYEMKELHHKSDN